MGLLKADDEQFERIQTILEKSEIVFNAKQKEYLPKPTIKPK